MSYRIRFEQNCQSLWFDRFIGNDFEGGRLESSRCRAAKLAKCETQNIEMFSTRVPSLFRWVVESSEMKSNVWYIAKTFFSWHVIWVKWKCEFFLRRLWTVSLDGVVWISLSSSGQGNIKVNNAETWTSVNINESNLSNESKCNGQMAKPTGWRFWKHSIIWSEVKMRYRDGLPIVGPLS